MDMAESLQTANTAVALAAATTISTTANKRTTKGRANLNTPPVQEKRRSSSRSIKRKRFDDEIVEYSVNYPHIREQNRSGRGRHLAHTFITSATSTTNTPISTVNNSTNLYVCNTFNSTSPQIPVSSTFVSPTIISPINNQQVDIIKKPIHINEEAPTTSAAAAAAAAATASNTTHVPIAIATNVPSVNVDISSNISPVLTNTTPYTNNTSNINDNVTVNQLRDKRRRGRSPRRRKSGAGRPSNQAAARDLGRWKPIDDLTLIIGVQQTQDLRIIHRACKFSCLFTLQEIQNRWYALLYEPSISRTAVTAMRNLHPEMIASVQRNALFSTQEEEILSCIQSVSEEYKKYVIVKSGYSEYQGTAYFTINGWSF